MKIEVSGDYNKITAEDGMWLTEWSEGQPLSDLWICDVIYRKVGESTDTLREIPYEEGLKLKEEINTPKKKTKKK